MHKFILLFITLFFTQLSAATINHRLQKGESLNIHVNIKEILRQDNPHVRGISIHGLTGYLRHPYAVGGAWQLEDALVTSIQNLHLANSRIFMVTRDNDISQEQVVDKAAEMYRKFKIPLEMVVLCLNNSELKNPQRVIEIISHSKKKGYGFIRWELGNEPWHRVVKKETFNRDPKEYQRQALAVAKAIRAYDPKIIIGLPVQHSLGGPWTDGSIKALAGYYDFVAGHHYGFSRYYRCSFEGITLTENYMILQNILNMNDIIKKHNPNRDVYQWDTEWGFHSKASDKIGPVECFQNANIMGTIHRAVRLIYYCREDYMRGATQWEMFSRNKGPGFGILTRDHPQKAFMPYWLNYYFSRFTGSEILDISGTAPYYTATKKEHFKVKSPISGPLTPVLSSYSKKEGLLYYIIANGSWDKSIPCSLQSKHFKPKHVSAIILSDNNTKAHPLVQKETDFVKPFKTTIKGNTISCTIPPHSIIMIKVSEK